MPATNVLSAIDKAKGRMIFKHVFFAHVIFNTPMIMTTRIPRAATNYKSIFVNEAFFETLSIPVVMFVIAHEIFHILLKHGLRRGGRDAELWNIAADYYINWRLKEYGFELWEHCLVDARFKDMYEEQIYEVLRQENQEDKDAGREPRHGFGDKGLDGDLTEYGVDMNDPVQRQAIERFVDTVIAQAVVIAKQAGKMPAGLELLLEGIINPPQPWLALLIQFMSKFRNEEETWARRNRRITRYVLPSRRNMGMGGIGVIGDTSASMLSYNVFPQVGAEIDAMMYDAKPDFVHVIWADYAEASHEQHFLPGDHVTLTPMGGGGTDMRLPLRKMEEYEVDVCILVTDAETPWPNEPTPFPLIILTTTSEETPEWAHTIRIR